VLDSLDWLVGRKEDEKRKMTTKKSERDKGRKKDPLLATSSLATTTKE
jgi:hypothetical protein